MNRIGKRLGFLIFLFSPTVWACGPLSLSVNTPNYSFNSGSVAQLEVVVTRSAPFTSCDFFIGFSRGSANSYTPRSMANGSNTIPYNFYRNGGLTQILRDAPDSTSYNSFLRGSFPNGNPSIQRTEDYRVAIGTIPGSPAVGLYTDTVSIKLYKGEPDEWYTLQNTQTLVTTYSVPYVANVSLVNTGAPYNQSDTTQTLNFGSLSPGQTLGFDIVTVYNSGYKLTLSSANNGKLKHSSQNQFVPYVFKVNGSPLNLSNSQAIPAVLGTGSGTSPPAGLRFAIQVQIGAVSSLAGTYSDTSVVEISAP
jgi:spore coat protein U-like protein